MAGHLPGKDNRAMASALPDEAEARAALVLALRQRGVGARDVLAAIERVPRRLFLSARHHSLAYEDAMLPIECGQIVSAPSVVAFTVQALAITSSHTVLEIGTGSGYQAAVMSHLAAQVETLDRFATLTDLAARRFEALKLTNVKVRQADGLSKFRQNGPYDRIVVNAAVEEVPDVWLQQLNPGGVLVAPVGKAKEAQALIKFQKTESVVTAETLMMVRTVMLQQGIAKKL